MTSKLRVLIPALILVLAPSLAGKNSCLAQVPQQGGSNAPSAKLEVKRNDPESSAPAKAAEAPPLPPPGETTRTSRSQFRVERLSLVNGAELLTIFGKVNEDGKALSDLPLLSVVSDTLGDADPENDRLRYVWMLTYTSPTLRQRLAAAVPFLYHRVGNNTNASGGPPPVLLNIADSDRSVGRRLVQFGLQHILLETNGLPLKLASRTYRRNWSDYYTAHVTQALSILSNYERTRLRAIDAEETIASLQPVGNRTSEGLPFVNAKDGFEEKTSVTASPSVPSITTADTVELRARFILSGHSLGLIVGREKFRAVVEKDAVNSSDAVGHNWELLRQRAEAEGLYFEPLSMPDGVKTHAVLWIAKGDLAAATNRNFESRFLNIANPWTDERLRLWQGYMETRYVDSANRPVTAESADARPLEMIPLAVYGLDRPKIPLLLVDFRDGLNPKKREVSGRALTEVASSVLSLSPFSLPYFVGRTAFGWITNRRGMDVNQPTRLNSYARLKLLLTLNGTIQPGLRAEIDRRLETVSPDPLTNDRRAEVQLARQQFDALLVFARRPDGLAAKIEGDRRAEMMPLKHGRAARFFFRLANALTLGRYVHRETATPGLTARMELARRIDYHLRFLGEATASTTQLEVTADLNEVKRSLQFVRDHAAEAGKAGAKLAARVFSLTEDSGTRQLSLDVLSSIGGKTAQKELLRVYNNPRTNAQWRAAVAESLRESMPRDQNLTPARARALLNQVDGK